MVVTGVGIITALGSGWRENLEGFRSGRTAFRTVTRFDVSRQRAKYAAEVDPAPVDGLLPLSRRTAARLDHAGHMLMRAVSEARQQSGWDASENLPLVLGTTGGGMCLGEDYFRQAVREARRHRRQPTRALYYQAQMQARAVLEALRSNGSITIISNACATGTNAVGHAWELLRRGQAQCVLAGGYEALTQLVFAGFDSLHALSPTQCRPFDAKRDGLAIGEGAAILALETLEHASARHAEIIGEIIGYGCTIDLHHLTQPHPEGNAALTSMTLACESAGIGPDRVDYVNAHGTGTPLNDSSEAVAIRRWAGARAQTLPVSSTKASIGHLLGAAGAVEAVVCLMALRERFLPPEIALENPDPLCVFPIPRAPQDAALNVAISNSFGFGGVNASLLLRRWL